MPGMVQVPFGRGRVTRVAPTMTPDRYTTYGMSMPLKTHWRAATCEEVDCEPYLNGWDTILPAGDPKADLVRSLKHHYRFAEHPAEGGLVRFHFPPGQSCFQQSQHRVPLERPARFIVAHGDWRGYLGPVRVHQRAEDWVEDMQIHHDRLATAMKG